MIEKELTIRKKLIILLDIVLTILAFITAYYVRKDTIFHNYEALYSLRTYLWVFWVIIPVWPILIKSVGLYNGALLQKKGIVVYALIKAVLLGSVIIFAVMYITSSSIFSRLFLALFFIFAFIFLLIEKLSIRYLYYHLQNGKYDKRVLLVAEPEGVIKFSRLVLADEDSKIDIRGFISIHERCRPAEDVECLGTLEQLNHIIKQKHVDEVVFIVPKEHLAEVEGYMLDCEEMGITVSMLMDIYDLKLSKTKISYLGSAPLLTYYTVDFTENQKLTKRIMDIIGAVVGLLFMAILYVIVGMLIKLDSRGPIIFGQIRVGKNGRHFKCYKFRSMYTNAEERKKELEHLNTKKGAIFKLDEDPRITNVGRMIRKTSLDEFPQFWNVLKGDMSLVGTRPPILDEVRQYSNSNHRRLSIKPGITGLWQVSGRNQIEDFEKIVALDVHYIDHWSLWLDIKILCKTVLAIFKRTGV